MSKNDKQQALVPRLRFPEFRDAGEWQSFSLGQVASFHKGKGLPKSALTDDGEFECIHYGQLFTEYPEVIESIISRTDVNTEGLQSNSGDVLMPTSDVTPNGLAKACCIKKQGVVLGGDILAIRTDTERVNGPFLARQIRRLERQVLRLVSGTTVFHLYADSLAKLGIYLPSDPAEQQKIADCLGSLDDLITAEGRKLAALRDHKKGLMQQLFPRAGETRPRLRFPEFRDAGEWDPRPIEQICEILNNRRVPITSSDRVPGPYPYYGASGIVDYVDEYIFDERLVLVGEDGAKWKAFEPTAFIADGKYWVNNHAHVLKPIGLIDTLLANYLTLLDVGGYVTGAAPPKLTLRKLKTIPIPVPPTDDEQDRIADCLASLDATITAQVEKLDALRIHKRGLMQQLFPSSEDAEA